MKKVILLTITFLGFSVGIEAKIWYVSSSTPIKVAVEDSAQYGDTVFVAPGIYDTASGEIFPINIKNGMVVLLHPLIFTPLTS